MSFSHFDSDLAKQNPFYVLRFILKMLGFNLPPIPKYSALLFAFFTVISALWLSSGFYRVEPNEKGVVLRFGAVSRIKDPGLHYHVPFPIEAVIVQDVTTVNRIENYSIGSVEDASQAGERQETEERLMLTGDENIVEVNYTVLWTIKDVVNYLFEAKYPNETIASAANSVVREIIAQTPFSIILTEGRSAISQRVKETLQSLMDDYRLGVLIERVEMGRIEPPASVIPSFRDVQAAKADLERLRNNAEAYYNTTLKRAEGMAKKIVNEAEAEAQKTISLAIGDAEKFSTLVQCWEKNPSLVWKQVSTKMLSDALARTRRIFTQKGTNGKEISLLMPIIQGDSIARPKAFKEPVKPSPKGGSQSSSYKKTT